MKLMQGSKEFTFLSRVSAHLNVWGFERTAVYYFPFKCSTCLNVSHTECQCEKDISHKLFIDISKICLPILLLNFHEYYEFWLARRDEAKKVLWKVA